MRKDRAPDTLRPIRITPGYLRSAEGSALVEFGNTKVICACSVEERTPPFRRESGLGWVTAEYSLLPRSTGTRTPREVSRGAPSGRTHEIQRLIGRCLRAVVDMKALGERTLIFDCDVLEADGGTRTAAITGSWVALILACQGLRRQGLITHNPVPQAVAAVSVGIVGGVPLLDLDYADDSSAEVDMNVAMTSSGAFVEIQGTAEGTPFGDDDLADLLGLAKKGIQELLMHQEEAVGADWRSVFS